MESVNLHIVLNAFRYDSRVLKELMSLRESGLVTRQIVAALHEDGMKEKESTPDGLTIWRIRLKTRSLPKNLLFQVIKYCEWSCRLLMAIRRYRLSVVHAHSISALPVGVLIKKLGWCRHLIYDAHELESKRSFKNPMREKLTGFFERWFIRYADKVVVVGDEIADWYVENYRIPRPSVIRNVPLGRGRLELDANSSVLRDLLGLVDSDRIFIFQGVLSERRAIPRFLEVFSQVKSCMHIVFLGYGPMADTIRAYAEKHSNIHYLAAVPPDKVLEYTVGADLGVCGMGVDSLSHRYSLPNKFFEYIMAGLPVLIGDRPEQEAILEQFNCGWAVSDSDVEFIELVNCIDRPELERRRRGALKARECFSWEGEAKKLLDLYRQMLVQA